MKLIVECYSVFKTFAFVRCIDPVHFDSILETSFFAFFVLVGQERMVFSSFYTKMEQCEWASLSNLDEDENARR